ncbi:hypothetical protein KH388_21440, partial [Serratia rubidaea]|nr:hypothetical protein [Serratia rubidaea]
DDLFFQEKKGRKLYFTPVLNKGKRSEQREEIKILSILREAEAGVSAREFCRRHAISDATTPMFDLTSDNNSNTERYINLLCNMPVHHGSYLL